MKAPTCCAMMMMKFSIYCQFGSNAALYRIFIVMNSDKIFFCFLKGINLLQLMTCRPTILQRYFNQIVFIFY